MAEVTPHNEGYTADDAIEAMHRLGELQEQQQSIDVEINNVSAALLHLLPRIDLSEVDDETYNALSQAKATFCNGLGLPARELIVKQYIKPDALMVDAAKGRPGVIFGPVHKPVPDDFFDETLVD
jgi:hypothetical protein